MQMRVKTLLASKFGPFVKKTKTDTKGATAVEFAMLGIPFVMLLLGIVELSTLFFVKSTLQHAVAESSRQVRTGEFQAAGGGASEFKTLVCSNMAGVGKCSNLRVDVISTATGKFTNLVLPQSPPPCTGSKAQIDACEAADPVMPADTYVNTNGGDVVIVRVQYVYHLATPSFLTRLANAPGNTHVITETTAFKNEPF